MNLRTLFILEYRFASYYDTEAAWQADYHRFCVALAAFDISQSFN
jgi:hypothetical protein